LRNVPKPILPYIAYTILEMPKSIIKKSRPASAPTVKRSRS
jgi:hypothetical protein